MKKVYVVIFLVLLIGGCVKLDESEEYAIELPYPLNKDILYYQAESDSGYQSWWTDIKAVTSSFLNNSQYCDRNVKPEDIIIIGEGIFHGLIEVELPDMILELTMERKFKSRGRKSVWQVMALKEKPWPKQSLK